MLLFPTKLDADLAGVPLVTTLVGLLCVILFLVQALSWENYEGNIDNFCQHELRGELSLQLSRNECITLMVKLDFSENRLEELKRLQQNQFSQYDRQQILEAFQRLRKIVPEPAVKQWWYRPGSHSPSRALSASVTHSSLGQLCFNLIFFFAFGISAEIMLGHWKFTVFITSSAVMSVFINDALMRASEIVQPTLGLTGVVTANMVFITLVYPHKFLRIFFWLIFVSGTFRLPLLLVSVGYLSSDVYTVATNSDISRMNLGAHAGGAICGALAALGLLLTKHLNHSFHKK